MRGGGRVRARLQQEFLRTGRAEVCFSEAGECRRNTATRRREIVEKLQIELACDLKKPLFVHERDAHDDLLQILNEYKNDLPPVLIHCFTGTVEQAVTYLSRGFYIGLTGTRAVFMGNDLIFVRVTFRTIFEDKLSVFKCVTLIVARRAGKETNIIHKINCNTQSRCSTTHSYTDT